MGAPNDLEKGAAAVPEPQKPAAFNTGGPAAYNSGAPAYPPMVQVRPAALEHHVCLPTFGSVLLCTLNSLLADASGMSQGL